MLKMIPKKDLDSGAWYIGSCRNAQIGLWGEKDQTFTHLRYKFGLRIDEIEHFEDVKDSGYDGFIPVKKIEMPDHLEMHKLKEEIGYYKKNS